MRWVRAIALVVVAIGLCLVAAGLYLSHLKPEDLEALLTAAVKKTTGRELSFGKPPQIQIFPLPSFVFEDVRYANAPWGTYPNLLEIERLEIQVRLLPLLFGELRVRRFVVDGPAVYLERTPSGRGNWEIEGATVRSAPADFPFSRSVFLSVLRVGDANLSYRDGASGRTFTLPISELVVREGGTSRELSLRLEAEYGGRVLHITGTIGELAALLGNAPYPVELNLQGMGAEIAAAGAITNPLQRTELAMDIRASAESLQEFSELFEFDPSALSRVEAVAKLSNANGYYNLDDVRVKASLASGALELRGRVSDLLGSRSLDLEVMLEDQSGEGLAKLTGMDLAPLHSAHLRKLDAKLTRREGVYALPSLEAEASVNGGLLSLEGSIGDIARVEGVDIRFQSEAGPLLAVAELAAVDRTKLSLFEQPRARGRLTSARRGRYSLTELQATAGVGGGTVEMTGAIGDLLNVADVDIWIAVDGVDPQSIGSLVAADVTELRLIKSVNGKTRVVRRADVFRLENAAVSATLPGGTVQLEGAVGNLEQLEDIALTFEIKTAAPAELAKLANLDVPQFQSISASGRLTRSNGSYVLDQFSAEGLIEGGRIEASGSVADLMTRRGIDVNVRLQGDMLARFSPMLRMPLPEVGPTRASFRLTNQDGSIQITDLTAATGDSALSGAVKLQRGSSRALITGSVHATTLDLNALRTIEPESPENVKRERLLPEDPLPLGLLQLGDADLTLTAKQVLVGKVDLRDVEVSFTLQDGRLEMTPSAGLAGGKLSGAVNVDATQRPPAIETRLDLEQFVLGDLTKQLRGFELSEGGKANLRVEFRGQGESIRNIAAGVDGNVLFTAQDSTIENAWLDRAGEDLLMKFLGFVIPNREAGAKTRIQCAVVRMPIQNGVATAKRSIAMETDKVKMAASGTIDLGHETLDLGANLKARRGIKIGAGTVARLVRLRGTFVEPRLGADVMGMATTGATVGATIGAAIVTGGTSLIAQQGYKWLTEDKHPCQTALDVVVTPKSRDASKSKSRPTPEFERGGQQ